MYQTELEFKPTVYQRPDGTQIIFEVNDARRIDMMINELKAICQREEKRTMGYNQLPWDAAEKIMEAVCLLDEATEWGEPTDDDLTGEPPITLDEMHSAAWKQHQEMHS
jgi:hypothetical protein